MILHHRLPPEMETPRPLPGVAPLDPADWLRVDEAYAPQMAERARLLAECPAQVLDMMPEALPAAEELLETALDLLPPGFAAVDGSMHCPDGRVVRLDRAAPLRTLGHLLQEDFCLLQSDGSEHVLIGAVLCFPSQWTLAEKMGRPLTAIHRTVAPYDAGIARRVQRLFDGIRPGRPLWRSNRLNHDDPALFQPRREAQTGPGARARTGAYIRCERQCLLRLPESRAVVFSIHTYLLRRG